MHAFDPLKGTPDDRDDHKNLRPTLALEANATDGSRLNIKTTQSGLLEKHDGVILIRPY